MKIKLLGGVGLSLGLLFAWLLLAALGLSLELEADKVSLPHILQPPGWQAWLGYDDLGRPILDRLMEGAATSLLVAPVTLGCLVGGIAAYGHPLLDLGIMRIIDIFLAFPGILLAIALAGVLGPGIENVIFALSSVGWVGYARLTRAQILSIKHREHVQAAVALGLSDWRILTRHLLPLAMAPVIVEASFGFGGVVIAEAGLSFLGLGVQPPEASWGSMIRDGSRYLLVAPHMVLFPGLALLLVVMSVNLLGDYLRDYLDVRNRH